MRVCVWCNWEICVCVCVCVCVCLSSCLFLLVYEMYLSQTAWPKVPLLLFLIIIAWIIDAYNITVRFSHCATSLQFYTHTTPKFCPKLNKRPPPPPNNKKHILNAQWLSAGTELSDHIYQAQTMTSWRHHKHINNDRRSNTKSAGGGVW